MEKLFYIRSRHGNCGTNLMFHGKGHCGYTTDLDKLEMFTLEEAQKELGYDITALPLLASEVIKKSIKAIDTQYMEKAKNCIDKNDRYVIQCHGCWNGNDAIFLTDSDSSFNYSQAKVFSIAEALSELTINGVIWSRSYIDTLQRRTFQEESISTRKMITGPGIKYKKPRKKKRTSGKTRMNCPSCGKIHWQYDPYSFDGCNDIRCDAWG